MTAILLSISRKQLFRHLSPAFFARRQVLQKSRAARRSSVPVVSEKTDNSAG